MLRTIGMFVLALKRSLLTMKYVLSNTAPAQSRSASVGGDTYVHV